MTKRREYKNNFFEGKWVIVEGIKSIVADGQRRIGCLVMFSGKGREALFCIGLFDETLLDRKKK